MSEEQVGSVAIIGAGITGLTAAFELQKRGVPVTIYESSDTVGGVIQTVEKDGFLAECGPNSILNTNPKIPALVSDLNLTEAIADALPSAQKRYIVRNGKPVAMPMSPVSFLKTELFSLRAKIRLMKEPFIGKGDDDSETLADFVRRRLGQEFLDYAIGPFVSGVFAGDAEMLAVAHAFPKLYALEQEYDSLIKGAILGRKKRKKRQETSKKDARMLSFKHGMHVLPAKLGEVLADAIKLNTSVTEVAENDSGWTVTLNSGESVSHCALLISIPAYKISGLNIKPKAEVDLSFFGDIYYPPVASLTLGFNGEDIENALEGFGMLIPKKEGFNSLGTLFTSSIFGNRAPDGKHTFTTYIGGAMNPDRALMDEAEMEKLVMEDLDKLLGVKGKPIFKHLSVHRQAIPQYTPEYKAFLEKMDQFEAATTGLYLAGHYRHGISVSDSILSGLAAGERIAEDVQKG